MKSSRLLTFNLESSADVVSLEGYMAVCAVLVLVIFQLIICGFDSFRTFRSYVFVLPMNKFFPFEEK